MRIFARSGLGWRLPAFLAIVFVCGAGLPGCGGPAVQHDPALPPLEWSGKFEKEHPEAFRIEEKTKTKTGKKTSRDANRSERRAIFVREWAKAQGQAQ